MQMQNQKQMNRKLKKSQILLLGSLLVFVGVGVLTFEYFVKMKNDVFTEMELKASANLVTSEEDDKDTTEVPITNKLPEDKKDKVAVVDYSKYLGVLEIPKIGLKRGFYKWKKLTLKHLKGKNLAVGLALFFYLQVAQ